MTPNRITTILLTALVAALYLSGCQKIETPANRPAPPDSSANRSEFPNSSATVAKVEKAMAAADITVADVAAFLYSRGWTIIPNAMDRPHWRRVNWAPADNPAYYVAEIRVAVSDTALSIYLPQHAGPYSVAVTAYRGNGTHSNRSLVGFSDNGDGSSALRGVNE